MNKGPSFGLSRECQLKSKAKFDCALATEALEWMEEVLGDEERLIPEGGIDNQFQIKDILKDGHSLCRLMNTLDPENPIKKIHPTTKPFGARENIEQFLNHARSYGVNEFNLFQGDDLIEGKNIYIVVNCIHALGAVAQTKDYYPWQKKIGVKVSARNERNFSSEVLNRGKGIINLQYGTNKVASQSGMTCPGTYRHI